MKKLLTLLALILLTYPSCRADEVNGDLSEIDGKKVLRLYGTHAERGYAYGYLVGDMVDDIVTNYLFSHVAGGDETNYIGARSAVASGMSVEEKFRDEAEAIAKGIKDAGFGENFKSVFGTDISADDILLGNAIVDVYNMFGCSSITSWGESTQDNTELNGELVITRHMDWANLPVLKRNYLIVVHKPSEEDEQKWASISFAGLMGTLSGINENGTATFHHVGNEDQYDMASLSNHIFFSIRKGLEEKDHNNDGQHDSQDIFDAVDSDVQTGGYIIDVVNSVASGNTPFVIECNRTAGAIKRELADNTDISGTNLCATNHFRKLESPSSCYRYQGLIDSLTANDKLSPKRSWTLLSGACGVDANLQSIQYIPSSGKIVLAYSESEIPAHLSKQTELSLSQLFATVSVEENTALIKKKASVFPNPASGSARIIVELEAPCDLKADVYSSDGQYIATIFNVCGAEGENIINWDCSAYSSGAYICKIIYGAKTREIVKIINN